MIANFAKTFGRQLLKNQTNAFKFSGSHVIQNGKKTIILRNQRSGYYLDPNQVARRVMTIIAMHEKVKNIQNVTLNTQWWQLGINDLDYVELTVAIEADFKIEFPDDVCQKFKDINDMVEYLGRSFWAV